MAHTGRYGYRHHRQCELGRHYMAVRGQPWVADTSQSEHTGGHCMHVDTMLPLPVMPGTGQQLLL